MKTHRERPHHTITGPGSNIFSRLGTVEVRNQAVLVTYHLPTDDGAPKYSDAELELLIATLKVAKEKLSEDIDRHITLFKDILATGGQKGG